MRGRGKARYRWLPLNTDPVISESNQTLSSNLLTASQINTELDGDATLVRIIGYHQFGAVTGANAITNIQTRMECGIIVVQTDDAGAIPAGLAGPYSGTNSPFYQWLWATTFWSPQVAANTALQVDPRMLLGQQPQVDIRAKRRIKVGFSLAFYATGLNIPALASLQYVLNARMLFRLGRR